MIHMSNESYQKDTDLRSRERIVNRMDPTLEHHPLTRVCLRLKHQPTPYHANKKKPLGADLYRVSERVRRFRPAEEWL